ncbi:MAG TPA: CDP-alcohol phosphatidyltransferase family protein [Candidatus Limnocylindria bacterium]|nr:CDP-alcohol phosphatidyltransferase family protein [Candidatus Limnocylindria bacterium]
MSHGVVPRSAADTVRGGLAPLARAIAAAGIGPNAVTVAGFTVTVAGAAVLATGAALPALLILLVGSLADTLDGAVARASGGGSRLGSFLDSTFDRLSDGAVLAATAWLGAAAGHPLLFWSAIVALISSSGVSYVRAKAESLGVPATVGPAPREARLAIFLLGLAAWAFANEAGLFVLAVTVVAALSTVTLVQRVAHVASRLSRERNT